LGTIAAAKPEPEDKAMAGQDIKIPASEGGEFDSYLSLPDGAPVPEW
jgi:hypothetical protein